MYRKTRKEEGVNTTQTTQTIQTIQTTQTTQTTQTAPGVSVSLTDDDKAILKVISRDPKLTQKEIAMELGWTVDRVKYYLNKLKKRSVIKRTGSSHNGHWDLLIEERLEAE